LGLIPDSIKKIIRPEKTEVRLLNNQYYVYPYVSIWSKEKKKAVKKSLPYCGKIQEINSEWEYVACKKEALGDKSEVKIWGDFAFVDKIGKSLYNQLVEYYGETDGKKIYTYAVLRLLYGDKNSYLDDGYEHSFISEVYRDVAVSESSILDFIKKLGLHDNTNKEFLLKRLNYEYRVLIFDGTQITNEADNAFSEFGRNAKKTNRTQAIEVKVYDTVLKEPVYYELVPGNVVDKTSFIQILDRFDVNKAIIIIDKGFNTLENINYLTEKGITYLMPFADNATIITKILSGNKYTHSFVYNGRTIKAMKVKLDDKFYYLYQDPQIASTQESFYIKSIDKNRKGYTIDKLNEKQFKFGVICFVSNKDYEDISLAYIDYTERWEIEVHVKLEKTSLENEVIRVHSTPGALGVRFLIQIEMILISRIYHKLKELNLLKTLSIRETLKQLSKSYKIFRNGKWVLSIATKKKMKFMVDLGLL
jgi:hypothetical protein